MGTVRSIPRSTHPVLLVVVRTSGGRIIGSVRREGARVVFLRCISRAHRGKVLFRELDAWPLGAHALASVQAAGCTDLRYRVEGEGVYSISLDRFMAQAVRREFPGHPEEQVLVPRNLWAFTPTAPPSSDGQTFLPLPMESPSWAR